MWNIETDQANAELEQLRMQLNQAIQEQNSLNQAMQNMDVSAANDAYLRLSQTVGNTERYIRDNVDELLTCTVNLLLGFARNWNAESVKR